MSACTCPTCGHPVAPIDLLIDHDRRTIARFGQTAELTPQQMAIFLALHAVAPAVASNAVLAAAAEGVSIPSSRWLIAKDTRERRARARRHIDVLVCRMRVALLPLGLAITTHHRSGHGLVISPSVDDSETLTALSKRLRLRSVIDATDVDVVALLAIRGLRPEEICERTRLALPAVQAALARKVAA